MIYTAHAQKRFAQRGITKSLVAIVMDYGHRDNEQGRWYLGSKQAEKAIAALQNDIRQLKKIQD
ncbi:MAG: DUF4258 domain-containing protein, partial [Mailhella sp.]|nr:DUF4258 domain-containing protein [Mailhella sp.]